MQVQYQRGAVSLLWAAVVVGAVALAAMVALMSTRYERNYFADAWQQVTSRTGQKLQQVTQSPLPTGSTGVRKCLVASRVVYSNVECDKTNPTSHDVALHETRGVEAPKSLPAPAAQAFTPLQDKAIERALGP